MTDREERQALLISGSGSDEKVVRAYQEKLGELGVASGWRVASAHRTPEHAARTFREFEDSGALVGGAVAGYQNALAAAWAANTTKPVFALLPDDLPDPVRRQAELAVLFLPPGVSAPAVMGTENGALAMAKVVAARDPKVAAAVASYLERKRRGVHEADQRAASPLQVEFRLYHRGSAKDVLSSGVPSDSGTARGRFVFTSRWSVFDFGHYHQPPCGIPFKDEALCRQTVWGFTKLLPRLGTPSHFIRQVDPVTVEVELSQIERDYSRLPRPNYLLPFEAIFRYRVLGSLYDRLKSGQRDFREFGFASMPAKGDRLSEPFVEFTTKLEPTDRNITDDEAMRMAALGREQLNEVRQMVLRYARGFGAEVESRGLVLGDGKLEFVRQGDRLLVSDVVCTLDEHRILFGGRDLSKEILRDYYRITGYKARIDSALASGQPFPAPPPLLPGWAELVSDAYRALTVAITGEPWPGSPSLEQVSRRYDEMLSGLKARFSAL